MDIYPNVLGPHAFSLNPKTPSLAFFLSFADTHSQSLLDDSVASLNNPLNDWNQTQLHASSHKVGRQRDQRSTTGSPVFVLSFETTIYTCVLGNKTKTSPPLNAIIHWPTQIQPKHGDVLIRQGTAHTAECIHLRLAWRLLDPNERGRRASKATLSIVGSLVSRWL